MAGVVVQGLRARDLLQTPELHIFLSHAHLDHCLGLTFLFDIAHQSGLKNSYVYGESAKLQTIENNLLSELIFPAKLPMEYRPLEGEKGAETTFNLPGNTSVTPFPLKHPGGSTGFLVEQDGKRIAYVTDTTASPDEPYLQHIQGADILIHECYFPDGFEEQAELTGHSCATPVAEVAKACNVGQLFLVHVNPLDESDDPVGLDRIRQIFSNARIPDDLDEITL